MQFRTEINIRPSKTLRISHADKIFMLGSCFTDNIGALLERDGFDVTHNPMGPCFHPAPLLSSIERFLGTRPEIHTSDFKYNSEDGKYHCLDFPLRYSDADPEALAALTNTHILAASENLRNATTVIITLGTAYGYALAEDSQSDRPVGNCHKFPATCFVRSLTSLDNLRTMVSEIIRLLSDKKLIFTVSPIRHLGDGLHGNQISKSSLILAIDAELKDKDAEYFPSYEIMLDDLRDYRFYAADMKHPSDVAIEYIYSQFSTAYFNKDTCARAAEARAKAARMAHRPILQP